MSEYVWEVPATGGMRVPGRVYADRQLMEALRDDQSLTQVANVAHLPGILCYSMAMPDIHFGYGFPIGGVAAFSVDEGVVSPGGVGYDINCGCRLMATDLAMQTTSRAGSRRLVDRLFRDVPSGVGASGAIAKLSRKELERVLVRGAAWAVQQGYGSEDDLEHTEDGGALPGADPSVDQRPGLHPRPGPGGHSGLGEPLPRGPGGGRGLRPRGGRGVRPARGAGHRHGALRFARFRVPGVRGLPGDHGRRQQAVPHRACPTANWPARR